MFLDFKAIKAAVSIEDAAERLNLELKKSANQLRGTCPACGGDERTLAITPARSLFYCFSAKKGGDQIELVSHITGLDVKDAAEYLAPQERKATVPQAGRAETTAPNSSKRAGSEPKTESPAHREPKKEAKGFDKEKFADSLAYDGEVEDLSEAVALRHRIGTKRGKLYIPICPPGVEPICWAELHDGQLRLPDNWLTPSNVVTLKRA